MMLVLSALEHDLSFCLSGLFLLSLDNFVILSTKTFQIFVKLIYFGLFYSGFSGRGFFFNEDNLIVCEL